MTGRAGKKLEGVVDKTGWVLPASVSSLQTQWTLLSRDEFHFLQEIFIKFQQAITVVAITVGNLTEFSMAPNFTCEMSQKFSMSRA